MDSHNALVALIKSQVPRLQAWEVEGLVKRLEEAVTVPTVKELTERFLSVVKRELVTGASARNACKPIAEDVYALLQPRQGGPQ